MRALYITSELAPLAKTGGLADVSATLPIELNKLGIDIRILLLAYPQALERLQFNAMSQDFSWSKSAQRYASLYHSLAEPLFDTSEALQPLRVAS